MFFLGQIPGSVFWGWFADSYGRRSAMIIISIRRIELSFRSSEHVLSAGIGSVAELLLESRHSSSSRSDRRRFGCLQDHRRRSVQRLEHHDRNGTDLRGSGYRRVRFISVSNADSSVRFSAATFPRKKLFAPFSTSFPSSRTYLLALSPIVDAVLASLLRVCFSLPDSPRPLHLLRRRNALEGRDRQRSRHQEANDRIVPFASSPSAKSAPFCASPPPSPSHPKSSFFCSTSPTRATPRFSTTRTSSSP